MVSYTKDEKIRDRLKDIEVISFDAGYTLLEPNPSFGGILAQLACSLGYDFNPEIINKRLFEAHNKYVHISREQGKGMYACEKQSRIFWDKIFKESYDISVNPDDRNTLATNCYDELSKASVWKLFGDVLPALEKLSSKYRLIVSSNWDNRLASILSDFGLKNRFEKIYYSTFIGHEKPDPEFFQYILDDLDVQASSVLHVGDHPVDDLQGSENMGMKGAVVKRQVSISPIKPDPKDFVVNSLEELCYYLPK